MTKNPRQATEIDRRVGSNLIRQRLYTGMSQEELGRRIGVTFQQIQKYECATNRISCSRLWDLSEALDLPVECFFAEPGKSGQAGKEIDRVFMAYFEDRNFLRYVRRYRDIEDAGVLNHVLDVISTLARVQNS